MLRFLYRSRNIITSRSLHNSFRIGSSNFILQFQNNNLRKLDAIRSTNYFFGTSELFSGHQSQPEARGVSLEKKENLKQTNFANMPPKKASGSKKAASSAPKKRSKKTDGASKKASGAHPGGVKRFDEANKVEGVAGSRARLLGGSLAGVESGNVLYWMERDKRASENWALLQAIERARARNVTLHVCYVLRPTFLVAQYRYFDFLLQGLEEVEQDLHKLNISFHLLQVPEKSSPAQAVHSLCGKLDIGEVICDMSPLRHAFEQINNFLAASKLPVVQVDAHNVVPVWVTSGKKEFAARTIRPKITRLLGEFLTEIPATKPLPSTKLAKKTDWSAAYKFISVPKTDKLPSYWKPGPKSAAKHFDSFLQTRLKGFDTYRNDPNRVGISMMSPYYNFGFFSKQRAALAVNKSTSKADREAYIEEMIVRGELSDNHVYYCQEHYDSVHGAENWAKLTMAETVKDNRADHFDKKVYTKEQLETAKTHDKLWNAAQNQLVREAKMHGFLRMYWAKKILEWTKSSEEALEIGIYLNDKYALDGCDPNGYVGVMWSICGVHDRAWGPVRPVFGKIRYMNYDGCKRKFDVPAFEKKYA